jgi:hypothetical protein
MTDYTKLVEALRCCIPNPPETCEGCTYDTGGECNVVRMMADAADAIEALQAEVEKYHDAFARLAKTAVELEQRVSELKQLQKRGEIVRCRECKHHEDEEPGMVYCPKIVGSWVSENWFCADGERKVRE